MAGKPEDFMIQLHVPKVISRTRSSARIFANFFTASERDLVEYRIDGGDWKPMEFTRTFDPQYLQNVFKWDYAAQLFPGRRPSNPDNSNHLWNAGFGKNLAVGRHPAEVKATEMHGKTFTASESFEV